jgi:5-methylcytosine-specific restriction endonuclease McrA
MDKVKASARRKRHSASPKGRETRAAYLKRPERVAYREAYDLKRRYGLTPGQLALLHLLQESRCAVCGSTLQLEVDHDHEMKKPRGLLCMLCNTAEGKIRASGLTPLEFARRLQQYLDEPPADILDLV